LSTEDLDKLLAALDRDLPDKDAWTKWPGGWLGEIEVCLVDAIYSANARYGRPKTSVGGPTGVYRVIHQLREVRGSEKLDDLQHLCEVLRRGRKPVLGNDQHSPGTQTLKEENLLRVAERLIEEGVRSSTDLADRLADKRITYWPPNQDGSTIRGLGRETWEYFLMLAGHTGVKADRMIRTYVATALGRSDSSPATTSSLVTAAASSLGVEPHVLDHAIWGFQRGQ
jgi:hypothetical protein